MPELSDADVGWHKSSKSSGSDNCVEVRFRTGSVDVRQSRRPAGPILEFSISEWTAFVEGVAAGELRP